MGTATQGILNFGIYTLLKFGGKNLERYFVTSGIATNNFDWSFELCRTQTQLKLTSNIKEYIENPIGNHLILIQGDFEGIINEWIKIFYKN
jgi:L-fucose isomerase-like protein